MFVYFRMRLASTRQRLALRLPLPLAPPAPEPDGELKQSVVLDYNKHMNGVDSFDQNLGYFSFHRKTMKWWKRLAFHLIHLAKVQAHTLHKIHSPKPLPQKEFTQELIRQLLKDVPMKPDKVDKRRSLPDIDRLTGRHFIRKVPKKTR